MNLKIENLSVSLNDGNEVLKDIRIEIKEREWVGLIGETGSGKTTFLRAILRTLPEKMFFKDGRILFNGKDILKIEEEEMRKIRGKEICLIIQEPHLYFNPSIKIYNQIEEYALIHGMEKKNLKEKIYNSLILSGFEDPERWIKMFPFQLSSGMLQRIGIGMALLNEPKFILADEPTSSLDKIHEKQIIHLLWDLKRKRNIGFIFVTHRIELLKDLTENIAVIYKGNLLEIGKTDEIFSEPFHPYTSILVGKSLFKRDLTPLMKNSDSCPFYHFCSSKISECLNPPPYFEKHGRIVKCWKYE